MGAATGREAVVAERAVGVEGMEEATAAAAQQALAGPAVKAMGSLVDRQRQIQTRLMRARPRNLRHPQRLARAAWRAAWTAAVVGPRAAAKLLKRSVSSAQ